MSITDLFQLADSSNSRLTHDPIKLLLLLQALLVLLVLFGVYVTSHHLRNVTLDNLQHHAEIQTHTLNDHLTQSLDLLHLHLRTLISDNPEAAIDTEELRTVLFRLQSKLSYVRSIAVVDVSSHIFLSTTPGDEGVRVDLGSQLPQGGVSTFGLLRFSAPWRGRSFASGSPYSADDTNQRQDSGFFPVTLTLPDTPQWTLLIAINSDYFLNLAPEHKAPGDLAYRAMLDDGTLLFSTADDEQPGSQLLSATQLAEVLHNHVGNDRWLNSEGAMQLGTYRTSYIYPWFIHTETDEDFALQFWQQDTRRLWLLSGTTLFVVMLMLGLLTHRIQRSLQREAQLQEQNRLAASVFLHSNDLIAITDSEKKFIAVNPAYKKITGFEADEVLGKISGPFRDGPESHLLHADIWKTLDTQDHWQGEFAEQHKEGHLVTGWLQVSTIRSTDGSISNYIGVFKDLSLLHASEDMVHKLSMTVEQSPFSIVMTTPAAIIEYTNPEFLHITGYTKDEVLGTNPSILKSGQTPAQTYDELWQKITSGQVWHGEFINQRKDGSLFHERSSISPIFNSKGSLTGYLAIKHDITKEKEAERDMRLAASVIANTTEGVVICDANWNILEVNPAFTLMTGYSPSEVVGQRPTVLGAGDSNDETNHQMHEALTQADSWQGEFHNRHKNGQLYITRTSVSIIRDAGDTITHYIAVVSDITASKMEHKQLQQQAYFDYLTGLVNRTLLNDRLTQALHRAKRESHWLAICFMDLDGFKLVNDTYGHDAGDELLVNIARRLKDSVRGSDTVARLGGDEFVLLLSPICSAQECDIIATRILQSVAVPVLLSCGHEARVTGSMGITLYPLDTSSEDQLLRHADQAMYQAKQSGRNRYVMANESHLLTSSPT